jgi:hypothetical protein
MHLRRGTHHSERLQNAWEKYGDRLAFSMLEECHRDELNSREMFWIDALSPVLNTTLFVDNVWANPQTRDKFSIIHNSDAWKRSRSEIAGRPRPGWRSVDCSNGDKFPSMAIAAAKFKVRTSGIAHLCRTQSTGRLGVRFKFSSEEWREELSLSQKLRAARLKNGTNRHSDQTRAAMRLHRAGWKVSLEAQQKAIEANRVGVIGVSIETGEIVVFASQRDATRFLHRNHKSASASISRACAGRRPSAFGFRWSKHKQDVVEATA